MKIAQIVRSAAGRIGSSPMRAVGKSAAKFAVAAAPVIVLGGVAYAQGDTSVFDDGNQTLTAIQNGVTPWVRTAGIIALLACGLIWLSTGRSNWKWLAGALGGLAIAGLAPKIVAFFI